MPDREKVIKGLECHQIDKDHRINCSDCPYHCDEFMNGLNELHNDALALLKEQEAVEPQDAEMLIIRNGGAEEYVKDIESIVLLAHKDYDIVYCGTFGRSVKWE